VRTFFIFVGLKLSYAKYALQFRHPFGLSHSTRSSTPSVFLAVEHEGRTGYGEATLPPYLGETQESVVYFFEKSAPLLAGSPAEALARLSESASAQGSMAARAALDIALHDLAAQLENVPVWKRCGLPQPLPMQTSVTIAIGDPALLEAKVSELTDFHLLKVKLGHANDKKVISAIRQFTALPLVVDVNQGWRTREEALAMIEWLAEKNVKYVEQPLDKMQLAEMRWLKERSPLPLLADESFQGLADLERIGDCFSGINLKLMKCGGITEGIAIMERAREMGLKINIGCMSESSCGIAAAAQLMRGADWIDLDGPLLIGNDPFTGPRFDKGLLHPSASPGLGLTANKSALQFVPVKG
jgi:L-Ala-D/L-Glu epimerase